MKLIKHVRTITMFYADCPPNFEELVDGNMGYEAHGDDYYIHRDWVLLSDISPEFKSTDLYGDLYDLFAGSSECDAVILQPR